MVNISWIHSSEIGKVEVVTSSRGNMLIIQKYICYNVNNRATVHIVFAILFSQK